MVSKNMLFQVHNSTLHAGKPRKGKRRVGDKRANGFARSIGDDDDKDVAAMAVAAVAANAFPNKRDRTEVHCKRERGRSNLSFPVHHHPTPKGKIWER